MSYFNNLISSVLIGLFMFSLIIAISCSCCIIVMLCDFYYVHLIFLIILFMSILSALILSYIPPGRVSIIFCQVPTKLISWHEVFLFFSFEVRFEILYCNSYWRQAVITHRCDCLLPNRAKTTLPRGREESYFYFCFILMLRV